jgi:hypothetical protein
VAEFAKGTRIQVEGINEVNKRLRAAGKDLTEMRDLMHRLGNIVISNARVPVDSGELAGTLRAGKGATKAVVRAGYAKRGAHAGVVHYGNPNTGSRAQPFLTDSLGRSRGQILSELTRGIDLIIRKNKL